MACHHGDTEEAAPLEEEFQALAAEHHDPMAMDLDRLGQVAAILGEPERACVLAGAAERLRESAGKVVTVKAFRWEQEPAPAIARRSLADNEIEHA